jgi:succinate dehydrogenase/fumarate reductase cytochrome b subunit
VWVFHRVSGVLLIFLLALQLVTGFGEASVSNAEWVRSLAALHRHAALNCLLVFLVLFHAAYGIRTIVMDLGLRREKLLFWICTLAAAALFAFFLVGYFAHVAP